MLAWALAAVLGAEQHRVVRAPALAAAAADEIARLVVVQAVDRRVVEEAHAPRPRVQHVIDFVGHPFQ